MLPINVNKIRMSETLLYTLLWTAIFLVPMLNAEMISQSVVDFGEVLEAWCKTIPYLAAFVINNNILAPIFLGKNRYGSYLLIDLAIIFAIFAMVDYAQENLLDGFLALTQGFNNNNEVTFTDLTIFGNVSFAIVMSAANTGIKLIYKSMRDDQKMEALMRHNMQIEMDYLKYQINPHFFMNTLNNIHALIDIDTESAKRGVIELSKMMRYVLYESGSESISLNTDLQFIDNYIELMRIRFDGDIDVEIRRSDSIPKDASIPPLLLIVFVENAFKHGVGGDGGFFRLEIDYNDGKLRGRITNSISKRRSRTTTSGIGLVNVRKRLELLYGHNFTLTTEARESEYFVDLIIPLCER